MARLRPSFRSMATTSTTAPSIRSAAHHSSNGLEKPKEYPAHDAFDVLGYFGPEESPDLYGCCWQQHCQREYHGLQAVARDVSGHPEPDAARREWPAGWSRWRQPRAGWPGCADQWCGHRPDPGHAAVDRQADRHGHPGRRLLRHERWQAAVLQ